MTSSGIDKNKSEKWYVWVIRPDKFEIVKNYLNSLKEVNKVLYPTITTENYKKDGSIKHKKSPLYAGYIFIQYEHNPKVWEKIDKHPFVVSYVGPCTAKDLATVDSMEKVNKPIDENVNNFSVGDKVEAVNGVFYGYRGKVSYLTENSIGVVLEGKKYVRVRFSPQDLVLVK